MQEGNVVVGGNLVAIVVVLFFVFLTMGAIVSVVQELTAQLIRARSRSLRKTVLRMLEDDSYDKRIFDRFYRHPRIAAAGKKVRNLTWIDPNDFAIAMATAIQPANSGDDAICALPDSILALQDGKLKQRLRLALPDVFRENRDADTIKAAVASWYNAQMNNTSEQFKVATRFRLFVVAGIITVLLNVSPIKIVEYLLARPELAQQFAMVVPELAEKVSTGSENALAVLNATSKQQPTAEGAATGVQAITALPTDLKLADFQPLLVLYQCKQGVNVLPIGWPWMAGLAEQMNKPARGASSPVAQAEACGKALASSDLSDAAVERLTSLGIATLPVEPAAATPPPATPTPAVAPAQPGAATLAPPLVAAPPAPTPAELAAAQAKADAEAKAKADTQAKAAHAYAAQFQPVYGPDPARDPWIYVILGWLITTVAAAQGAPFWFDLLRKLVSRK